MPREGRAVTDGVIPALVWRALLGAARTPAVWAVMAAQIVLLALYLLVWGDGVPLVGARPVLEQFGTTQWVFLGLALPWAAARCGAARRRDDITQIAVLGAVRPSAVVTATVTALALLLLVMALVGLPFAILAQQISAAPVADLWRAQFPLYALSLYAATVAAACMLVVANRLLAWTVSTALTLGLMALAPAGAAGVATLLLGGAIVFVLTVSGADRRFWYLSEQA
jgi:hypothetical protein